jgi:hypothetical protein
MSLQSKYSRGSSGKVFPSALDVPSRVDRTPTGKTSLTAPRNNVHNVLGASVTRPRAAPSYRGADGSVSRPYARRSENAERQSAFSDLDATMSVSSGTYIHATRPQRGAWEADTGEDAADRFSRAESAGEAGVSGGGEGYAAAGQSFYRFF